jgi:hypothetical protein
MTKQKTGAYARRKGHAYECQIAAEFRALGWTEAATSRNTNRLADVQGIDLQHTSPFAVQCKNTAKGISYANVLQGMQHKEGEYPVVFSKLTRNGEYVVLRKEDFYELLLMAKAEGVL